VGDVLGGTVGVASVVLSGSTDDHTGPESHSDAAEDFPLCCVVGSSAEYEGHLLGEHEDGWDNSGGHEDGGDNNLPEESLVNSV